MRWKAKRIREEGGGGGMGTGELDEIESRRGGVEGCSHRKGVLDGLHRRRHMVASEDANRGDGGEGGDRGEGRHGGAIVAKVAAAQSKHNE